MTDIRTIDCVTLEIAEAVEVIAQIKADEKWAVDHQESQQLGYLLCQHKAKLQVALRELVDFGPQVRERNSQPSTRTRTRFADFEQQGD